MPTHRYRRIEPSMVEAVAALESVCFDEPWSRSLVRGELERDWCVSTTALDPALRPTGYAIGRLVADEMELLRLAVHPEARRMGIGRALLQKLMGEGAERGARTVYLEVSRTNTPAVALYRDAGFRVHSVRGGYYQSGRADALVMRLILSADR